MIANSILLKVLRLGFAPPKQPMKNIGAKLILFSTIMVQVASAQIEPISDPSSPTHETLSMYILKPHIGIDEYQIERVILNGSHLTAEVSKNTKPLIFLPAFGYEEDHITIKSPAEEVLSITAINQFNEHIPSTFLLKNKRLTSSGVVQAPQTFGPSILLYEARHIKPIVNTSNRSEVSPNNPAIAGFVINEASWIIILGIAPSLNEDIKPISDPILTLYSNEYLKDDISVDQENSISNDNWQDTPRKETLEFREMAPSNENESALVTYLYPGPYTVHLTDNRGSGSGIVEVYIAPYALPQE